MEGMGGMKFNSPPKPAPRGDDVEEEIVDIDNTAHDEL